MSCSKDDWFCWALLSRDEGNTFFLWGNVWFNHSEVSGFAVGKSLVQAGLLQKGVCHLWEDLKTGVRITAGHGGAPHLSSVLLAPAVRMDLRTQWEGGWNWVIFTVPSYPNHSKIL